MGLPGGSERPKNGRAWSLTSGISSKFCLSVLATASLSQLLDISKWQMIVYVPFLQANVKTVKHTLS